MIRPLTIATCLLACGSGLFLYQSKHEVQVLDRTIERTVHDTGALREQSRLLAAEWTMLNDPERLRQFSDTYLNLKTIAPTQFTSLADLDTRLPVPRPAAPPAAEQPDLTPVAAVPAPAIAAESDPAAAGTDPAVVAEEPLPVPPIPAVPPAPVVASVARPADTRVPDRAPVFHQAATDSQPRSLPAADVRPNEQHPAEPRYADQHPADQRGPDQRVVARGADVRTPAAPPPRPVALAAPRPLPANGPVYPQSNPYRPMVAAAAPYGGGGSLLGMARGSTPPAPRPTPVSAAYNAN
jgi:hypothetical protein